MTTTKRVIFFIFIAAFFCIGLVVIPHLGLIYGEPKSPDYSPYSMFSGLGLASLSFMLIWFSFLRKSSSIPKMAVLGRDIFALVIGILALYALVVYAIGIVQPSLLSVSLRMEFFIFHSVFTSIGSGLVYLMGLHDKHIRRAKNLGNHVRVLTSILAMISLTSIAITLQTQVSSIQRAVLMCGYGFLALSSYSLGYVCAALESKTKLDSICLVLSGLLGFYFSVLISSASHFNIYMFSFTVQALLIIGIFLADDYLGRLLS